MGEIHIDQTGLSDQFGDALNALAQDIICQAEGEFQREIAGSDFQQAIIGDGDEGIAEGLKLGQSGQRVFLAAAYLKRERCGNRSNGYGAQALSNPGGYGDRAGSGSSAHSGSQEDHVCSGQGSFKLLKTFFGGSLADPGITARAQTAGELRPQLDFCGGKRALESLSIGVGSNKFHTTQT